MERKTQREIREWIAEGHAVDLDRLYLEGIAPDYYELERFAYSSGTYGVNGGLWRAADGTVYGVVGRTSALFAYL